MIIGLGQQLFFPLRDTSNKTQLIVSSIKIRHALIPLRLGFEIKRKKYMSCTKISRYRQLNAWRMEITMCTGNFSCKTTFF